MDILSIQTALRKFAQERDWEQYHSPKNLSMALAVEASELLEIFQWMTPEESVGIKSDPGQIQAVQDELADILNYVMRLADVLDVDVEKAVMNKIERNAKKYPPLGSKTPRSLKEIGYD